MRKMDKLLVISMIAIAIWAIIMVVLVAKSSNGERMAAVAERAEMLKSGWCEVGQYKTLVKCSKE